MNNLPALTCALVALTAACDGDSRAAAPETAEGPPLVRVVNEPLRCFAARIGGDLVRVELPAPAGVDPAFWTPAAEVVLGYQQADLVLLNGAGYAGWVELASLPPSRLVDTSAGFSDRLIEETGGVTHAHGPEGEHAHAGTAFTTWLDPALAALQARATGDALARLLPEHADALRQRTRAVEAELAALDERLVAASSKDPGRPLLGSHPVYQYLQRRYDLNLVSLHWEPDEHPDDAAWAELEALLAEHPARWMLWEGQPLPETAARLRALRVEPIVFSPCGNTPPAGDFLDAMAANVEALEAAYAN